jgi:hypothetical protein
MKLNFSILIPRCSPHVILSELERHLRSEAWEIWRGGNDLTALGIGASHRAINLSDRTIFSVNSIGDAAAIEVSVEFQAVRSVAAEVQTLRVRQRHEAILAHVCEYLGVQWIEQEPSEERDAPIAPIESSSIEEDAEHSWVVSDESFVQSTSSAPISAPIYSEVASALEEHAEERASFRTSLQSASQFSKTLAFAGVLTACVGVLAFFSVRQWKHSSPTPSRSSAPSLASPSRSPDSLDSPHAPAAGEVATRESSPTTLNRSTPSLQSDDVKLWVNEWAASERTRDADVQTNFYADHVRPYLNHASYNRRALYLDKQDAIRNRKGLWTFNVEHVSIRKRNKRVALVDLTKHFMTQAGTVEVAEQWIPSRLVLVRVDGRWKISAEQDFSARSR